MKPEYKPQVGDEVWYYSAGSVPAEAVVVAERKEIFGFKLKFTEKHMKYHEDRWLSSFSILKRPEQWKELVEEMREDAALLLREANSIEQKYDTEE